VKNDRLPIEREIAELEQKTAELKSKGPIDQLHLVEAEAETLNNELKYTLRHLQKPFIKIQALAMQGGGAGLTQDELRKLSQYLEKPFEALATEATGYPVLKQILQKLTHLIADDRLKLKADKARKAEQTLNEILQHDVLAGIQVRCTDAATREKQLLASTTLDEIKRSITLFQGQIEHHKARKLSSEAHETIKTQEYNALLDRIRNHKSAVEKNVYASLGKKVQIT
jgi:hypothetical protein